MATTTIQVSKKLINELKNKKLYDKESYEEVIWDLLEDSMELSEQTKKDIEKSREEYKKGNIVSFEKIKKDLGL